MADFGVDKSFFRAEENAPKSQCCVVDADLETRFSDFLCDIFGQLYLPSSFWFSDLYTTMPGYVLD